MRPEKLIIQAFGPFAETEELDFTLLGSNPLFLINGPTGAGKSSILDAICFALYGQATGKERDASQMRCDHAEKNCLTEVTLDFSLAGKKYRIRRSPQQKRPKTRGEGSTIHQTEAQFWEITPAGDNLLVPRSATDVTRRVEVLTGLNVEQFRQVMVLPQGKFREFLMADSSQRETIFSKLFQTQIYKRIEDSLKVRASSIRKDVEALNNKIKGILHGVDISAENEVQEEIEALGTPLNIALSRKDESSAALVKIERSLAAALLLIKDFDNLTANEKELHLLESKEADINQKKDQLNRARAAQKIEHLYKTSLKVRQSVRDAKAAIVQVETSLLDKQQSLENAQKTLDHAELSLQSLDALKENAADLRKLMPKIEQLNAASSSTRGQQAAFVAAQTEFVSGQGNLKAEKIEFKRAELRGAELRTILASLPEKQHKQEKLLVLGKQKRNLDDLFDEKKNLNKSRDEQVQNISRLTQQCDEQNRQLKSLELLWHSNQAIILAAELEQGVPCPVCGSKDHPLLAIPSKKIRAPEKSDIDAAKLELERLQGLLGQAQRESVKTEEQLRGLQQNIKQQKTELGEHQHQSTQHLRDAFVGLDKEIKELMLLQTEQAELDSKLPVLLQQLAEAENQFKYLDKQQQISEQNYLSATQAEKYIEAELPETYRKEGVLEKAIKKAESEIVQITRVHQDALFAFNEAKIAVTGRVSTLAQQKDQCQSIQQACEESELAWQQALNDSDFESEGACLDAVLAADQQQSLDEMVQDYIKRLSICKAMLAQQKERLAELQRPDRQQLEMDREKLKEENDDALNHWQQIDNRRQQLCEVQKKLKAAHQSNVELEDAYAIYGTLSEVANGHTGNKLSLQRFVLSVLLDDVLLEASERLKLMSKGRYQLQRNEERAKGNKASGLELVVDDAYTGKTRSVATLSGGESFMAALSLALGLSDVVQAYAGGIKLDTLFIDEGFGSLDQESLDLAIQTLTDLQSTGRMIGIISHVSELREQMALRIDVQSSVQGSHIAVRVH